MSARGYFVTGTDTGVGKTRVVTGLLKGFQALGLRVLGMKPIACGLNDHNGRMINDDVADIAHITGQLADDRLLCCYALADAMSPNIAAERAAISIEIAHIVRQMQRLQAKSDVLVVEGAGGWQVPISATETMADLARALGLPVILTVGLRLGCLNHALLTAAAIRQSGALFAGWIANELDPAMLARDENIATLTNFLAAPPLALLPFDTHGQSCLEPLAQAARILAK
jgi:dethiobiotin synthetase